MKLFNLFRKTEQKEKSGKFSDFFLHASERRKEEILKEAAHKANEEQRKVFPKSHLKTRAR
ncbi:MAG: hypothetical protein COU07_00285 [Candidatus Harrisonbacteria bacterium CG10_big_fil_rev_8_21_14_0_10_40_38]|uniref:Uncharacterized protein n=1 Tax=Candidatus Harrisonbacteria bacterium CG10_big_fil_rev_8_21_14_0_10_40_38 TaxID=1974583 RepID=A0A2H0USD1_9BACT|nr:MAG: hypothetical protein COU07_00285 [Candidatus Harrisonbacteria bacterium CG10_big_fil_rev_8_21_14_0_10_40_38]